ncbi:hypothetical protein [Brevundimonas sp.]|uniref:hypothetical protein n=1 Tax=Brevundimonas sp. TaxID=1871086 RepID=UPI002621698D|nr:hypothetical protein [Brevundimonas sp.]
MGRDDRRFFFRHPGASGAAALTPGPGGARERDPVGGAAAHNSLSEQVAFGAARSRGSLRAPGMTKVAMLRCKFMFSHQTFDTQPTVFPPHRLFVSVTNAP